jgi:hypothetical protein
MESGQFLRWQFGKLEQLMRLDRKGIPYEVEESPDGLSILNILVGGIPIAEPDMSRRDK